MGITATRLPALDGQERYSRALGIDDPAPAISAVAEGRYADSPETSVQAVYLKFQSKEFAGNSFGLAAVLADKAVRLATTLPDRRLVATGCLIRDGQGSVGAVDGFEEKVRRVLIEAERDNSPSILFAVAADNWSQASPELREAVAQAERNERLTLLAVSHSSDLEAIWKVPVVSEKAPPRKRRAVARISATALFAVTVSGAALLLTRTSPLHRCETAAERLESVQNADTVGNAIEACSNAHAAAPRDGRAAFLLAQIHFLNGSKLLAERYWREAAADSDTDGMAAMGRLLRTDHRGPEADIEAVAWLRRAIEAGRTSAKEDLGWMYFEGRGGLVQDQAAGQELWRAASRK